MKKKKESLFRIGDRVRLNSDGFYPHNYPITKGDFGTVIDTKGYYYAEIKWDKPENNIVDDQYWNNSELDFVEGEEDPNNFPIKKKKEIIILVGNIGCGKTTLCNKYVKKGYYVISRDALRYMIGNGKYIFDNKLEPIIKDCTLDIVYCFLHKRLNIIIDEVNVTRSLRMKYILKAKEFGYKVIAIELPRLPKKQAVDNRMKNPHSLFDRKRWERVWDMFDKAYEKPTKKEGIDKIIKIKK